MSVDDWENRALERHCSHWSGESSCGKVYPGREFLSALQSLKGGEAAWLAHKVEPFFWSDADMIHVRLCDECAAHLGLDQTKAKPPPSLKPHFTARKLFDSHPAQSRSRARTRRPSRHRRGLGRDK